MQCCTWRAPTLRSLCGGLPVEGDAFDLWFLGVRGVLDGLHLPHLEGLGGIDLVPRAEQIAMGKRFLDAARAGRAYQQALLDAVTAMPRFIKDDPDELADYLAGIGRGLVAFDGRCTAGRRRWHGTWRGGSAAPLSMPTTSSRCVTTTTLCRRRKRRSSMCCASTRCAAPSTTAARWCCCPACAPGRCWSA